MAHKQGGQSRKSNQDKPEHGQQRQQDMGQHSQAQQGMNRGKQHAQGGQQQDPRSQQWREDTKDRDKTEDSGESDND